MVERISLAVSVINYFNTQRRGESRFAITSSLLSMRKSTDRLLRAIFQ
jgi:hypothetical protein